MDRILLVGTETVERAGHRMEAAADVMRKAAESMDYSLMMHKQFLEDWLSRFENVLKEHR